MRINGKLLVLASLCLLPVQASFAADTKAPATDPKVGQAKHAKADTDSDGAISKQEYLAAAEARFKALDANNDGKLTADEQKKRKKKGAK